MSSLQNTSDVGGVKARLTFEAPKTAQLLPNNRARSFHGVSDVEAGVSNIGDFPQIGAEEGEAAAAYPWSDDIQDVHGGGAKRNPKDKVPENWRHTHTAAALAKGKFKERVEGSMPPMPKRSSTFSLGQGLDGHSGGAFGGLGWEAIEAGDEQGRRWNHRSLRDGESPLDRTIDTIGMGKYQKTLLILSGLGYLADNMWLQGVAIVLPRVQDEFGIGDRWIGLLSSSMFAGMMVGALAWGSYSDSYGRKNAFNGTLFVTAIFGCASSFATSFPLLCALMFMLGSGVGGSMPTDGTLFLENLPKSKQYLLTALSVFFALGSVITSVLGLMIIPKYSCPEGSSKAGAEPCNVQEQNQGWRWLLNGLGFITVCFVVARIIFFRLFESPKFLVASGRHQEARRILQRIAQYNGRPLPLSLRDVQDESSIASPDGQSPPAPGRTKGGYDALPTEDLRTAEDPIPASRGESPVSPEFDATASDQFLWLPARLRPGAIEFAGRYTQLFEPRWRRTTILVWAIWTLVSLAFTIFNVFLPKFLEARLGSPGPSDPSAGGGDGIQARRAVMQDYLLYALASVPGSLLGAWMIETRLGRIGSMALSTACTGLSILAFTAVTSRAGIVLSSMFISISATTAYAAIYGYTPEVFTTEIRGTACGSASALSRFAGIIAPLVAGVLLSISINLPLFLSVALFAVCVTCMLALPYETRKTTQDEPVDEEASPE